MALEPGRPIASSEERYRIALAATGIGVWEWDCVSGAVFWSPECMALAGVDEFGGTFEAFEAIVLPEDRARVREAIAKAIACNAPYRADFRVVRPDRSIRWLRNYAQLIRNAAGEPVRMLGTAQDITQTKALESAMRNEARRSALIIDSLPQHVWIADPGGAISFVNGRAEEYVGTANPRAIGDAFVQLVHPDDASRHMEAWHRALRTHQPFHSDCRLRDSRGEYHWFTCQASPLQDEAGGISHWFGSNTDSEAEREAHEARRALRENEERLQHIVASSPDVIHSFRLTADRRASFPYASSGIERLYGFGPETLSDDGNPVLSNVHPDDVNGLIAAIRRSRDELSPLHHSWRVNHPSIGEIWVEAHTMPSRDPDGATTWHGVLRDVTDRRRMELELQMRSDALENALAAFVITDATNRIVYANQTFLRFWGFDGIEQVRGRSPAELCADPAIPERISRAVEADGSCTIEFTARRRDGSEFETLMAVQRSVDADGAECLLSTALDITGRREMEDALRTSQARLLAALEVATVGTWVWEVGGDRVLAAARNLDQWGVTAESLAEGGIVGAWTLIVPEDRQAAEHQLEALLSGEQDAFEIELRVRKIGGEIAWMTFRGRLERDSENRPVRVIGACMDITASKEAEAALRASEQRFVSMFRLSPVGNALARLDDRSIVDVNDALIRLFQGERGELVGHDVDSLPIVLASGLRTAIWEALERGDRIDDLDYSFERRDGSRAHALLSAEVVELGGERFVLAAFNDVTQRRQAEEALEATRERLEQVADNIQEAFWLTDPTRQEMLYVSRAFENIWGRSRASLIDEPDGWLAAVVPEDQPRVQEAIGHLAAGDYDIEYRIARPDGEVRWIRDRAFPVLNDAGEVVRIAGVAEDITGRRELESQLRQAQKMESVGQLAGGIAHDFNNWLTVIQSYSDLLSQPHPEADRLEFVSEIRAAAGRAASLTKQLLAFSRMEVVEEKLVDLDAIVLDTERMLGRLLGDGIEIATTLASSAKRVKADPTQLVQVVMNLAVNARDAMPGGGHLDIVTAVTSGTGSGGSDEIVLRVSDTGSGMSPEVLARIFDPFFTTKGVGKGTGMGLAVVHGVVEQCGGRIEVVSTPSKGTVFTVYFPSVAASGAATEAVARPATSALAGTETILLAEDEESIRRLAVRGLTRQGYTVLTAANGEEAWQVFRDFDGPIHAVVTDVMMPKMDGRELAERIRALQPGAKVIYSSGYTGDAVLRHGELPGDITFVQKPYTIDVLLRRIRETLDAA